MERKRRFKDFSYNELLLLREAFVIAWLWDLCSEVQKEIKLREESK